MTGQVFPLEQFKLCYIDEDKAFFTTQNVQEQWGDDFNDAPYDCNAGDPYTPTIFHYTHEGARLDPRDWNEDGTPKWQILTLRFSEDNAVQFKRPCDGAVNPPYESSYYSVEGINAGQCPWLRAVQWSRDDKCYKEIGTLPAGATMAEFIEFIEGHQGIVWVPHQGIAAAIEPKPRPDIPMDTKK